VSPLTDPLQSEQRFQSLMRSMNFSRFKMVRLAASGTENAPKAGV